MAVNAEQNQQEKQDQQNASTGGGAAETSGGVPATQSRVANYSTGQQPGQANGGRFTNLQKYIGANAGAGDRLAQGITSKVNQQNQPAQKEADTSASAVREGIQSANQKLDTGNQYLNQVQGSNFNANDIAQDQNKLQDFTNYRTGQAVDPNALAAQNQTAQTNNLNYQNQLNNQLTQTASDQGRYNLLKNAFSGGSVYQNPYSTGQQRLDQLFLQSGGQNGINTLQNNLRTNLNGAGQQLNNLTGQSATDISRIGTQAQNLASGLQNATTGMTNKYVGDIEATQDAVNKQRLADQDWANKQYQNLQGNGQIDQRFASLLGLNQGQNIYNTLSDKNVNNFLNYGKTNLTGADQLANSNQRAYYDSLAKLSGVNPDQYAINAGGDPEAAVSVKDQSLQNAIAQTRASYDTKNYTQSGGGTYGSQIQDTLSGKNLNNILNTMNPNDIKTLIQNQQSGNGGYFQNNDQYNNLIKQIMNTGSLANPNGVSDTGQYVTGIRQGNANQALLDLINNGYFHGVNIASPSDTESGGQFGVK